MIRKPTTKPIIYVLLFCVFVLIPGIFLLGFHLGKDSAHLPVSSTATTAPKATPSKQQLVLSARISHEHGNTSLSLPNREQTVLLCNLYDVRIDLTDGTHDLEDALAEGFVTLEEIIAWAKQDAAQGFCKEIFSSKNGFANFIYRYAQLELSVYDDVYEAPDGQQHLIRDLTIRESGGNGSGVSFSYINEKGERKSIDQEDWGLTFAVEKIDENTICLTCTQSGGQQIGQLEICDISVYHTSFDLPVCSTGDVFQITENGETAIKLDCAELSSGEYNIRLLIKDRFDPEKTHPFMRDFEDSQYHSIEFTLP